MIRVALAVVLALGFAAGLNEIDRPNALILLADDLWWDSLGY